MTETSAAGAGPGGGIESLPDVDATELATEEAALRVALDTWVVRESSGHRVVPTWVGHEIRTWFGLASPRIRVVLHARLAPSPTLR